MSRFKSLAFILLFAAHLEGQESSSIAVDFDSLKEGPLRPAVVEALFGEIIWESLNGRATVQREGEGMELRVDYPAGKIGSEASGAQFTVALKPARSATLRYRFRLAPDFPFVKGGKLPGLAAGGSQFTGGRPPGSEGGWSSRYMWRSGGALELYFYHPKMKDEFGERHSLGTVLKPGEVYEITQWVDVGDPGKENGELEVYLNGERKLRLEKLSLHGSRYGPIDTFLFSTFYGGSGKSWAPEQPTWISFDDFEISPGKPTFPGGEAR